MTTQAAQALIDWMDSDMRPLQEFGFETIAEAVAAVESQAAATFRDRLREAIADTDEEVGLEHWHFARGGRTSPAERSGVFVDRGQVLDAIDGTTIA